MKQNEKKKKEKRNYFYISRNIFFSLTWAWQSPVHTHKGMDSNAGKRAKAEPQLAWILISTNQWAIVERAEDGPIARVEVEPHWLFVWKSFYEAASRTLATIIVIV